MGVKHGRDYGDILSDLTAAVGRISDCYTFFEMEPLEWYSLSEEERLEVQEALAEDLFFALGNEPTIQVGSSSVSYDRQQHQINIWIGEDEVASILLI